MRGAFCTVLNILARIGTTKTALTAAFPESCEVKNGMIGTALSTLVNNGAVEWVASASFQAW